MGFWHVNGPHVLGPTQVGCSAFENEVITPLEATHARIAYRRSPGNRDPDRDPGTYSLSMPGEARAGRPVECGGVTR